ncbi:MAG TPA: O-antigen ligase family protein [Vicinamibacterales bacterium]|nr:O-antigen ligase family protein [Vicinamibacterales bacterium]
MSNYVEARGRPFGGDARNERTGLTFAGNAGLERAAYYALLAFVALLPFSIAASQVLLTCSGVLWFVLVIRGHERFEAPAMFWPLAAYAGATLVASLFSVDPETSFIDCKQLLLFSIVPIAFRLLPGRRALTAVDVIITVGAISAVIGVVQFGILEFDSLGQRPRGLLGMYMTYSGQLMLVACLAAARILFRKDDRLWTALVMPALIAALAATLSRNAWVGACVGIGLLFVIRDFRLFALLPVAIAAFIAFAPSQMTDRLYSSFRVKHLRHDTAATEASLLSNRDRLAMIRSGFRIIKKDPLTGVGPDMVVSVYASYRDPNAVQQLNSHLHNVPLQIAAERGLPALAIWLWFIVMLIRDFVKNRMQADPSLAYGALSVTVAMVAAGMFEYNFGDSEVLMLFLVLVTLPYAATRSTPASPPA